MSKKGSRKSQSSRNWRRERIKLKQNPPLFDQEKHQGAAANRTMTHTADPGYTPGIPRRRTSD